MDRTRRSSSSSLSMPPNAFPRRRHPTIRASSQEREEDVRLKANKRDSDWSKRRTGGNERQHCDLARMVSPNTASSASDQNPQLRNIADEVIGATVPRRTRSVSVKRPRHTCVEEQSVEVASPSSSNISLSKKMKSIGPKMATVEDIEIEIAELLYGLRTSHNHDSSLQKLEPSHSHPSIDAEKKKVEDFSSSTPAPNNSTAESLRIECEQPAKTEKPLPESPRMSDCNGVGSSQGPKEDIEEDNLNSSAGCGDTVDGRSESNLDVDKHDFASTRAMSDVTAGNGQNKFEIDLMASPPMPLSPERDNLLRCEDGIEGLVKKEKTLGEIEEVKKKIDLEELGKHNDLATNHELEKQDRNKEQPATTLTNRKVEEKTVLSSSMPLSTPISTRPSSLSSLGCTLHLDTIAKMDKTTGSSTAPQHVNFVLSQPRSKRCATHHYIARNIFMHQQFTKMSTILPLSIGCGSVCDTKHNNVNRMHSAESVVVGKQSHKHSPGTDQNAAQEKHWTAASDYSLAAIGSSGPANPMNSTQMKQLVFQQGLHSGSSGNLAHGPASVFPLGLHQASGITGTSHAGGVNSTGSASLSNNFYSSAAGYLRTSTLPAAAAMSFSYPNLATNDAPYVTVVQNSGYLFPFSTPLGASTAIRGANPAQSTPMPNGPLYSSQIFPPLQYPQQHPFYQPLVQPSCLNASTSNVSSSSHKQSQGMHGNGSNNLISTTMQLQLPQSQKQQASLSHTRKQETGAAGENASTVASGTAYSQKNVFGQNFTVPVQPLSLSFTPSVTSDSDAGNSGNFGDKQQQQQQQQQALKGGVEQTPSQAFAISFAAYNGTSVPSNLNFSTMAQNPVIFQNLPDIAWQGCQAASTSDTTQQKMYSITEGKSGGNSAHRDDEKKATSGKPSSNGPMTLVFDNSSKNLNFVSSPMNGNWPIRSITSTASIPSLPLSSNASNSQQPPQLLHLQQQPAASTRYKAPSISATTTAKILDSPPVYSQTQTQCKHSNQGSQSKNLGKTTPDSQVHSTIITSTTPTLQSFSHDQGRVIQGHTQISFGGNYISSLPLQGQQLLNNNQPLSTTVAGTPPCGGNMKTNSQGSKVSSPMNTLHMQQTENSTAGTGQKSSPVCGRTVPSILTSCPGTYLN